MKRQLIQREHPNTEGLEKLHPLLARLYAARGVTSCSEVEYGLGNLQDVWQLSGIRQAAEQLLVALQADHSIVIIGDFDADGATSTALALRGLRAMGFRKLDYLIPNRFDFGYGLSPEIVDVAARSKPDLIITVDNGIASLEGVARARQHDIDVIITDHHLPGKQLPDALAIVNPNQPGDEFPSKSLAGVGVMFYLLIALRKVLHDADWFTHNKLPEPNLAQYLDLVALGTVADVVPLDHNNRILVEQGLRRIRAGKACPGILALLKVAGKNPALARATDMGFIVGPRLNAAGRLEDMAFGIECLLTDDPHQAERYARDLDSLNRERREIEADMQAQALSLCNQISLQEDALPWGLALHQDGWHQGVVGLVASRIKERYHRPVIAFADAGDETLKGSARSIPGLHMRDALERVHSQHPGMIEKFGGHAMAAGLSMKKQHLPAFQQAFDDAVRAMLPEDKLNPVIISDGDLSDDDLSMETASLLQTCGPWGQTFPEPVFDGRFQIRERRVLKEKHLKFTLQPVGGNTSVEAIVFNIDPDTWPAAGQPIHLAYTLDINRFRGAESLQLIIADQFDISTAKSAS
ncbi:MAG TPA: single-stranded-DNA-specific exonuclease RecJ [Gammaproteobacteria bacterium]|nr:single-stranded-DNA-specific exonuclease RecJ [Gammaproteobacteria bacterium]